MPGDGGVPMTTHPAALQAAPAAALACALALSACTAAADLPPAVPAAAYAPAIQSSDLVGSWGIASFRKDEDRKRVEAMARQQCKLPYVIAKGTTDGVMMHVADDAKLHELKLKGSADGRTYVGFEAPPGHWQDREILEHSPDLLVMRFVDAGIANRYGTFVYLRCTG